MAKHAYGAKQYHPSAGNLLAKSVVCVVSGLHPHVNPLVVHQPLLKLLGQDAVLSEMVEQYTRLLIPMLFASGTFQAIVRFFQTQNGVHIMPVFSITTMTFHVPLLWFLIDLQARH